ncbi:MAG TPA: c-type cytochrome biogenesis protein CcmI, partial [Pyrinomonadaceae bacterium]|nr:c-type cytochrome biogenesis protein CcmI [Pyrinomonadaceae bacterium]
VYSDQLAELAADLEHGIVSKEQYEQDRDEIERRLLEDASSSTSGGRTPRAAAKKPQSAYVLAVLLPLVAVVFYLKVGDFKAISNPTAQAMASAGGTAGAGANDFTQQRIEANVAALAKRLESNPNDADGWTTLGRSYTTMEKFPEAAKAYAKANELKPGNADLLTDYAFAMAMANGRQLQGEPMSLINKALQIEPDNAKALQLAGSAAFQAKDYQKAIDYWERVLSKVPPGSDLAQSVQGRISEAKSLLPKK